MRKTLKSMSKLKIALTKLKPLRIFLIAGLSVACSGAPKFPTDRIYEVDLQNGVCGEYQAIDLENLKFKFIKDHPLSKCNGVFGFSTSDIPKVLRWGEKTQEYIKEKCK